MSTAWHRVASRLESYVDLGLLVKPPNQQYEYAYSSAPHLDSVVESLRQSNTPEDWMARHLVRATTQADTEDAPADAEAVLSVVPLLARVLGRKEVPIPIVSVALAMVCCLPARRFSLGSAVAGVQALAIQYPHKARLSRGGTGFGAQFVSFLKG
jgi:hypothetical protein